MVLRLKHYEGFPALQYTRTKMSMIASHVVLCQTSVPEFQAKKAKFPKR